MFDGQTFLRTIDTAIAVRPLVLRTVIRIASRLICRPTPGQTRRDYHMMRSHQRTEIDAQRRSRRGFCVGVLSPLISRQPLRRRFRIPTLLALLPWFKSGRRMVFCKPSTLHRHRPSSGSLSPNPLGRLLTYESTSRMLRPILTGISLANGGPQKQTRMRVLNNSEGYRKTPT